MKLAIISHTAHYKTTNGTIVGWSPTVNEINHLLAVFDTIYHVAMLHEGDAPASALAYASDQVVFVPLPPSGGRTVLSKFDTLFKAPKVLKTVSETLRKVDCFQLRTPTGIGVYLIPYLSFFSQKKGWYKYAGNWNQAQAPLGYALQRFMLRHQKRTVTINGQWETQPKHSLTFENPCLTVADVAEGQELIGTRMLPKSWTFCYAGRLEDEKGVGRIIAAFTALSTVEKSQVKAVHLVGNGADMARYQRLAASSGVCIIFHGFLSRTAVFDVYRESDVFIMPTTASEGFPKVIAEAMNFGCIPMVSDVSAIVQYVKPHVNGFVIDPVTAVTTLQIIRTIMALDPVGYKTYLKAMEAMVFKFTFEHYNERITTDILSH
ncbi:glycosyltransferase [Lacinutrix undariae]